jgi:hypothetical protein
LDVRKAVRRHALPYWPILRRAIRLAAVVGTILFVISQAVGELTDTFGELHFA